MSDIGDDRVTNSGRTAGDQEAVIVSMTQYTETDARAYYDEQDELYKQCWAADGTTHWGYFEDPAIDDLQTAGWLWTQKILDISDVTADSRILEIGCGNGAVAIWLAQQTGCEVVGIDISGVRVDNAKQAARAYPDLNVRFVCGSITQLPFENGEFTHVWGQGVLYHIPDLDTAFLEVSRVLAPRGVVVIDDFVAPEVPVGDGARRHFYERLKFNAKYTRDEYMDAMRARHLLPVETRDMGAHIARTYHLVARSARSIDKTVAEWFEVCEQATQNREIVGYFFKCVKVDNPVEWVYESASSAEIAARYDAWAATYDDYLSSHYVTPVHVGNMILRHVQAKETPILDAGCGTGLVGHALAKIGYTNIDGLDISSKMLEIARQKQCYSRLTVYDLGVDDKDVDEYPVIISAGCITFGHAPGYTLARIFSWLAPGGIAHITVRRDFMQQDIYFKTLLEGLRWDIVDQASWSIGASGHETQHLLGLVLRKHPSS